MSLVTRRAFPFGGLKVQAFVELFVGQKTVDDLLGSIPMVKQGIVRDAYLDSAIGSGLTVLDQQALAGEHIDQPRRTWLAEFGQGQWAR